MESNGSMPGWRRLSDGKATPMGGVAPTGEKVQMGEVATMGGVPPMGGAAPMGQRDTSLPAATQPLKPEASSTTL